MCGVYGVGKGVFLLGLVFRDRGANLEIPSPLIPGIGAAARSKYPLIFGEPREKSGERPRIAGVATPDVLPVLGGEMTDPSSG